MHTQRKLLNIEDDISHILSHTRHGGKIRGEPRQSEWPSPQLPAGRKAGRAEWRCPASCRSPAQAARQPGRLMRRHHAGGNFKFLRLNKRLPVLLEDQGRGLSKTFSLQLSEVSTSQMRGQNNATLNKGRANLAKPQLFYGCGAQPSDAATLPRTAAIMWHRSHITN